MSYNPELVIHEDHWKCEHCGQELYETQLEMAFHADNLRDARGSRKRISSNQNNRGRKKGKVLEAPDDMEG